MASCGVLGARHSPWKSAHLKETIITDADIAVTSLEESIKSWPGLFKDLNDGGDTRRWQKLTAKELAPAALQGQQLRSGVSLPGIFAPGEQTLFSFPAFFDGDPVQTAQPTPKGVKVKFNGKREQGIVVITDTSVKTIHLVSGGVVPLALPRSSVTYVDEVALKLSMLSMTSAGSGYEVLFDDRGEPGRLLFRVALEPRDQDFTRTLRSLVAPG